MYTPEDKAKLKHALAEGDFYDILVICMMRNGATLEEIKAIESVSYDVSDHALNKIIEFTAKYYNISKEDLK